MKPGGKRSFDYISEAADDCPDNMAIKKIREQVDLAVSQENHLHKPNAGRSEFSKCVQLSPLDANEMTRQGFGNLDGFII